MAEDKYEHGNMDVTEHERTFDGFVRIVAYTIAGLLVAVVLLYAING